MVLVMHVVIALAGIVNANYVLFRPSRRGLYTNYGLMAATIVSGTYLVITTHASMLSSCVTGLCYIGGVSFLSILAARKLAHERLLS